MNDTTPDPIANPVGALLKRLKRNRTQPGAFGKQPLRRGEHSKLRIKTKRAARQHGN